MKRTFRTALLIFVLLLSVIPTATAAQPGRERFIVVFRQDVGMPAAVAEELAQRANGQVGFVYEHVIKGFSIELPAPAAAALANDPRVAYVEADLPMQIASQSIPTGLPRSFATSNGNLDIDGADDFRVDVDVAVLDTGIDLQHPDLNIAGGIDCTLRSGGGPFATYYCGTGNGGDDDHYHGTHVAGTIGAIDNGIGVVGVAPGARLWAVKVLNSQGSGYTSGIIAGIDWVAARGDIEVINMSLGGSGVSTAYKDAIDNAVSKGVVVVVAAGNSDADANNYSPAYVPSAITVSALADFNGQPGGGAASTCRADVDDTLADFSNWGSAVDIAAPGVCILSTYPIEQGSYGTISGTSMASPHVAGAAALLASRNNPNNATDVQNIRNTLVNNGNLNWTDDSGDGIHERLLDLGNTTVFNPVLVAGGGGGGSNNPPTVSISSPTDNASFVSGTSISFSASASDVEDGNISANLVWSSNLQGQIGTGAAFSAVLNDGTHTITASVTDSASQSGSDSVTITVTSGGGGGITLSVVARKQQGNKYADLTWSGATSASVDIYRNGAAITTTANDGTYTDGPLGKGGGSATYKVCEAGSATVCSATMTATW